MSVVGIETFIRGDSKKGFITFEIDECSIKRAKYFNEHIQNCKIKYINLYKHVYS